MQIQPPLKLETDMYSTSPCISSNREGIKKASYSQRDKKGNEFIRTDFLVQETPEKLTLSGGGVISDPSFQASSPVQIPFLDGFALAWVENAPTREEDSRLVFQTFDSEGAPTMAPKIVITAQTVRWPALSSQGESLILAVATSHQQQHSIFWWTWNRDNGLDLILSPGAGENLVARPALASHGSKTLLAWEEHATHQITIEGVLYDSSKARLSEQTRNLGTIAGGRGFAQSPSLVWSHEHTAWLAFSHDAPNDRTPGLSRWIFLRKLTFTRESCHLEEPLSAPRGMNLDADGEDQSFEFPTLHCGQGGALWILGRCSHNFRIQSFSAGGWGELHDLDPMLWGCRGTRISVASQGNTLMTVAHGRRGMQYQEITLPPLKAPRPEDTKPVSSEIASYLPQEKPHRPTWEIEGTTWRPYWGDIHFHTACSDGVGTVEEAYLRSRDRYGDDFACLTDHDAFIGRRVTDTVWRSMVDTAEAFHRPEEGFSTLIGIEYTGVRFPGPGHKCIYFPDADAPLVCRWDELEEPGALLERVESLGGFAIPHHVGWLGGDPEHHRDEIQPCWEVCSAHGQYEAEISETDAPPIGYRKGLDKDQEALRSHFIRRQLEKGRRFGFVGGSDGHGLLWHHGISHKADSHRTGLTGVLLEKPDRKPILDAIRARRTWATSGAPIALAFTCNGHLQGSIMSSGPGDRATLHIYYSAPSAIASMDVMAHTPQGTRKIAEWTPRQKQGEKILHIPGDTFMPERGFLYVRLMQEDRECAWASPVFW